MSDGRLPVGPLHEALRTHLELAADLDVVDVVLNRWQGRRSDIATLSRIVADGGDRGRMRSADPIRGGRRTRKTRRYHKTYFDFGPDEKVPVSYSGGVFSVRSIVDGFERPSRIFMMGTS